MTRGTVLKVLVSGVLLVVLLRSVPLREIGAVLAGVRVDLAALGIGLSALMSWLNSYRLRLITDVWDAPLSTGRHFVINLQVGFYGLLVPGYLSGGAVRWYKLNPYLGDSARTVSTIVYNRVLDLLALLAVGLAAGALAGSIALVEAEVMLFGAALLAVLAIWSVVFSGWTRRAGRMLLAGAWVPRGVRRSGLRALRAIGTLAALPLGRRSALIGVSLAIQALGVGVFVAFAGALSAVVPPLDAAWIRSLLSLALMLPVSVAGLGVREVTLVGLLGSLGVASSTALGLSVLLLGRDVALAIAGGALELAGAVRGGAIGSRELDHP